MRIPIGTVCELQRQRRVASEPGLTQWGYRRGPRTVRLSMVGSSGLPVGATAGALRVTVLNQV